MRSVRSLGLLRLWLLVLALFFGQAAMLAHGVEHLDGGEPPHACRLCLAGQSVDGPVPPASPPIFNLAQSVFSFPPALFAAGESAAVAHRLARGPPSA
jgi:hypothetical protein